MTTLDDLSGVIHSDDWGPSIQSVLFRTTHAGKMPFVCRYRLYFGNDRIHDARERLSSPVNPQCVSGLIDPLRTDFLQ